MAFVFLIQFTVVKMENLEYRLLSSIHFMIMIQLFPLILCFCGTAVVPNQLQRFGTSADVLVIVSRLVCSHYCTLTNMQIVGLQYFSVTQTTEGWLLSVILLCSQCVLPYKPIQHILYSAPTAPTTAGPYVLCKQVYSTCRKCLACLTH